MSVGESDIYEVEYVIAKKYFRGKAMFLVKWKGYDDSKNTWEPYENVTLDGQTSIIDEFEDRRKEVQSRLKSILHDVEQQTQLRAQMAATSSSEPLKINKKRIIDDDSDSEGKENVENVKNSTTLKCSDIPTSNDNSEETSSTKKRKLVLDDDEDDKLSYNTDEFKAKPTHITAKFISSLDTNPLSKVPKKNPNEINGVSQPPFRIQKKKILPPSSSSATSYTPSLNSGSSSQNLPPLHSSPLTPQRPSSSIPSAQLLEQRTGISSTADNTLIVNRSLSHSPPTDPRLRLLPKPEQSATASSSSSGVSNVTPSTSIFTQPPQVINHNGTQDAVPSNQKSLSTPVSTNQTNTAALGGISAFLSKHTDDERFSKFKRKRNAPAQLQINTTKEHGVAGGISTTGPVSPSDLARRTGSGISSFSNSTNTNPQHLQSSTRPISGPVSPSDLNRSSSISKSNSEKPPSITPPSSSSLQSPHPFNKPPSSFRTGPVSPSDTRYQPTQRIPSGNKIVGPISPTNPMRSAKLFSQTPSSTIPSSAPINDTRRLGNYASNSSVPSNKPVTTSIDASKERPPFFSEKPMHTKSNAERPLSTSNGPISPSSIPTTTPFKPPSSRPLVAGPISPSDPNRSSSISKSNSEKPPSTTPPSSSYQQLPQPFNKPPSSFRTGPVSPSDARRQEDRSQRKEYDRKYDNSRYSSSSYHLESWGEYSYSRPSSSRSSYYDRQYSTDRYNSPSFSGDRRNNDPNDSYSKSSYRTSSSDAERSQSSSVPTLTNSPSSSASSLDSVRSNETETAVHVVESDLELTDGVNLKLSNLHIQAFVKGVKDPKFPVIVNVDGTAKWDFENHGKNAIKCLITSQEPNDLPSMDKQASNLKKDKNAFRAKWDIDGRRYKLFIYPSCREVRSAFSINPPDFPLIREAHFVALLHCKTVK
ncbi:hypothetical protein C9374_007076 [Naegleria lovaniensis]|uniref:Chromo domain-containing protein n=1 Tax=Naegleria lovaniensis TaxID=51637 RepID=A0AA88GZ06_NAELO|nr:uncharacterized protein C9374_007076 [Naegleria lovaniensis]KAG2393545.1 hypothetical protein C9374_007076 [Naegleria lovaniensis]